jgi:hypothetical protein
MYLSPKLDNGDEWTNIFQLLCPLVNCRSKCTHRWKVVVDRLCQLIQPENATSLTLWNSYTPLTFNEIDVFFSSTNIHRFTQLCFFNITNIKEFHLRPILHYVSTLSILQISNRSLMNDDIITNISSIIALSSLLDIEW